MKTRLEVVYSTEFILKLSLIQALKPVTKVGGSAVVSSTAAGSSDEDNDDEANIWNVDAVDEDMAERITQLRRQILDDPTCVVNISTIRFILLHFVIPSQTYTYFFNP